jgi:hypothetical protein
VVEEDFLEEVTLELRANRERGVYRGEDGLIGRPVSLGTQSK